MNIEWLENLGKWGLRVEVVFLEVILDINKVSESAIPKNLSKGDNKWSSDKMMIILKRWYIF